MRSSSSLSDICPCATRKRRPGHSSSSFSLRLVDRLDAVVEVERLPSSRVLALERHLDQLLVVLPDGGADRAPTRRRRLDDRDVAQSRERHVERPRDRRRREREHVDLEPQRAQELLLRDAEALLLVENDEPEVLRDDVAREDAVRPDEHVDLPLLELREDARLVGLAAEARDHLDPHRKVAVALAEGVPVLLREDRRRAEHERLPTVERDARTPPAPRPRSCRSRRLRTRADPSAVAASRSSFTASIACCWSSVSRYGNELSSRSNQSLVRSSAWPGACRRCA